MVTEANFTERREHKRYRVKEGAFIVNCGKSGLITDISEGGLTFRYVDRKRWSDEPCELDIVFDADDFYLDRVPCKTVSDLDASSALPDNAKVIKRHSIQFGELTPSQKTLLAYFIENHTDGELLPDIAA